MTAPFYPRECEEHSDRRPRVVLRDAKGGSSEYRASNPSKRQITVIAVDGCCIKNREACDYLMLAGEEDAYLIELKGSHVIKAIQQIHATLDVLEKHLRPRTIHARIVPTRVPSPNLLATHEIKLRKRLGGDKRYKAQARVLEETL